MSSLLVNEFEPSDDHAAIREGVRSVVTRFGDDYSSFTARWLMPGGSESRCRRNMAVPASA